MLVFGSVIFLEKSVMASGWVFFVQMLKLGWRIIPFRIRG